MSDGPFDLASAAGYLHIKPSYLYQLTHRRLIGFCKPTNGRLLFLQRDLDNFVLRGRRPPDHEKAEAALLNRKPRRKVPA